MSIYPNARGGGGGGVRGGVLVGRGGVVGDACWSALTKHCKTYPDP